MCVKYIFYGLSASCKQMKTNITPIWNALLIITLVEQFNMISVLMLSNYFGFHIVPDFKTESDTIQFYGTIAVIMFMFNYFYLYRDIKRIYVKYSRTANKRTAIIISYCYIVVSLILMWIVGVNFNGKS